MRSTLSEIDYLTSQVIALNNIFHSIHERYEQLIQDFYRQVMTALYQGVEGFSIVFSDQKALLYLCGLFDARFLEPVSADLPSLVHLIFMLVYHIKNYD